MVATTLAICVVTVGDTGRSELVDTPIRSEERVAMMEEGEGGVVPNGEVDDVGKSKVGEGSAMVVPEEAGPVEPEAEWMGHLRSIDGILGGNKTIALHQEFLIRNNNSDLQILKNTKVIVLCERDKINVLCTKPVEPLRLEP